MQSEKPDRIIQSESDNREYRSLKLSNSLQVLLVSDPETDKASAAMDVAIGSGHDPAGREGLAHFLEHMLFLGTEKYPEAGEYQAFINAHGGSHNAFTAYDHTNYFFDVDAGSLEPALDRFSQQFVAPLFTAEYVQRETNAVHSEYTAKLKDDSRRFFSVLKEGMNPRHPMAKFSVGTLDTLADRPDQPVREDLLRFYRQNYSADIMNLVVYGKEPLDVLESWVRPRFETVPLRSEAAPSRAENQTIFAPEQLPQLITTQPVKEKQSITLLFPVPPTKPEYHVKPLYYLSNLIGHEGEGSLLSWLKSQQLAEGLSAGLFSSDEQEAIFSITVQLTSQGLEDWERVVADTMAYIRLLQSQPVDEWRYEEQRKMLQIAFRFQDQSAPIHYTSGLASRLKDFSPEEVLIAPYLMDDFEPDTIRRFLDALSAESLTVMLQAPNAPVSRRDPWYDAPYSIQSLDLQTLAKAGSESPELHLPRPNPFIPDDLTLLSGESDTIPRQLEDIDGVQAWYARDLSFEAPKSAFYLSIRTPTANKDARSLVLSELYVTMAREQLSEYTYPATLAGLDFRLYKHQRGMTLRIDGFSEKQAVLLDEILKTLNHLDYDPQLFERFREDFSRDLRNSLKNKPFERLATLARQYLIHPIWNEQDQLEALEQVTLEDLKAFGDELFAQVDLVTLSIGNVDEDPSRAANRIVQQHLLKGHQPTRVEKSRIRKLSPGLAAFESVTSHPDSAYLYLIQGASKAYPDRARMGLISQVIGPAYYTQIRTESQMGYVVFATPFTLMEVPALAFIVQSPANSPAEIHQATKSFLGRFLEQLETMDEDTFRKHQRALIGRLTEEDKTLEQRADRWWNEIDARNPAFDSMERVAQEVQSLTQEDLIATYKTWFLEQPRSVILTAVPTEKAKQWTPDDATLLDSLRADWESLELFPGESSAVLERRTASMTQSETPEVGQ